MATTVDVIRDRIASVCASAPFAFVEAATPLDLDRQPTGASDGAFRVTSEAGSVIGGFSFAEERTDLVDVWIARKQAGAPRAVYRQLVTDQSSLRAAIIRDGVATSGEYSVPDDGA